MTLQFAGGPSDGFSASCPIVPPPIFYLPTGVDRMASVYSFSSVAPGLLTYILRGYLMLSAAEAHALFD